MQGAKDSSCPLHQTICEAAVMAILFSICSNEVGVLQALTVAYVLRAQMPLSQSRRAQIWHGSADEL